MENFDWETALNKDNSLYFCPLRHSVLSNYKIKFEMYNFDIIVSDAVLSGKKIILFEWIDEDDEKPATIGILENHSTIESMVEILNTIESIYHNPIYSSIHGWAVQLFYK